MTKPNAAWIPISVYCAEYSLDRRTLTKLAENGIVQIERIIIRGSKRPVLRVRNQSPFQKCVSIHG